MLNIYVPNVRVSNFIKQNLLNLKSEIVTNAITVNDFDIQLLPIQKSSRKKYQQGNFITE
jgi:hypothetical protein